MKLNPFLTPHTKINPKSMKDLNVRQETIRILEENTGNNLFDVGLNKSLRNMLPEVMETKPKMKYWNFIKIKICTVKETTKLTGNLQNRRRYLQMTYPMKC